MRYLLLTMLGLVALGVSSCGVKSKKLSIDRYDDITIVKDIQRCESLIKPNAIRPSVCGKCSFSTTAGQLIIKKRVSCPRYTTWKCTLTDGREFVINNLGCEGSVRFK